MPFPCRRAPEHFQPVRGDQQRQEGQRERKRTQHKQAQGHPDPRPVQEKAHHREGRQQQRRQSTQQRGEQHAQGCAQARVALPGPHAVAENQARCHHAENEAGAAAEVDGRVHARQCRGAPRRTASAAVAQVFLVKQFEQFGLRELRKPLPFGRHSALDGPDVPPCDGQQLLAPELFVTPGGDGLDWNAGFWGGGGRRLAGRCGAWRA